MSRTAALQALLDELVVERFSTVQRPAPEPTGVTYYDLVAQRRRVVAEALDGAQEGRTPGGVVVPLTRRRPAA